MPRAGGRQKFKLSITFLLKVAVYAATKLNNKTAHYYPLRTSYTTIVLPLFNKRGSHRKTLSRVVSLSYEHQKIRILNFYGCSTKDRI